MYAEAAHLYTGLLFCTCESPHILHEELFDHNEPESLAEDEVHLSR